MILDKNEKLNQTEENGSKIPFRSVNLRMDYISRKSRLKSKEIVSKKSPISRMSKNTSDLECANDIHEVLMIQNHELKGRIKKLENEKSELIYTLQGISKKNNVTLSGK
jgi:hypothetical protein